MAILRNGKYQHAFLIEPDIFQKLEKLAKDEDRSLNNQVNKILKDFFNKNQPNN